MKNKLFYSCCFVFLFFSSVCYAQNDRVIKISRDEIKKIEAHNLEQQKNMQQLKEYQRKHSDLVDPQDDGYWNLAWHAKFADYGDKDSQYIVAKAYEDGVYTETNLKKSLAFYKKAAESGHIEAAMKLGRIYLENEWVQKDEEKALYYYLKAATLDYAPAQMKVAELYEDNQEYEDAYNWLSKAVRQMFPHEKDLEERSPDLKRIANKMKKQKEKENI